MVKAEGWVHAHGLNRIAFAVNLPSYFYQSTVSVAMSDSDANEAHEDSQPALPPSTDIQPSWKPLWWLSGGLILLIGLWEGVLLELGLNIFELLFDLFENIWLVLIEAPEEFLEDQIAEWLKNHFPHEADRYSEIITAIGLTPLKVLLVFFLARWTWRHARVTFWPRVRNWFRIRVIEVRLAWTELGWPYRLVAGVLILVLLVLLI